jgi:hypothetical protein
MLGMAQDGLQAGHCAWFKGASLEELAYVGAFGAGGDLGLDFGYASLPSQPLTVAAAQTPDPLQNFRDIGNFSPYDLRGSLAYASPLGSSWNFGARLNVTDQTLNSRSAVGLGFDLGLMIDPLADDLKLGIAAQNLGFAVPMVKDSFSLPILFRAGLSYRLLGEKLMAAAEADLPLDNNFAAAFGLEYNMDHLVYLRMGYRYDSIFNPFSMGLGFRIDSAVFDIAWVPAGELGQTFSASLGYSWGGNLSWDKNADLEVLNGVISRQAGQNGDLSLRPLTGKPGQVTDWALSIYDSGPKASLIRTLKGRGPVHGAINWDGKLEGGQAAPDGAYDAQISLRFKSGDVAYSGRKRLLLNPAPPEIHMEIQANSRSQGDPNLLYVPAEIRVASSESKLPFRWRLEVMGEGGRLFERIEGALSEPSIQWTGRNPEGESFVSNSNYQFKLSLLDPKGNVLQEEGSFSKRCVFRQ